MQETVKTGHTGFHTMALLGLYRPAEAPRHRFVPKTLSIRTNGAQSRCWSTTHQAMRPPAATASNSGGAVSHARAASAR
jgi:hypothetical protein